MTRFVDTETSDDVQVACTACCGSKVLVRLIAFLNAIETKDKVLERSCALALHDGSLAAAHHISTDPDPKNKRCGSSAIEFSGSLTFFGTTPRTH